MGANQVGGELANRFPVLAGNRGRQRWQDRRVRHDFGLKTVEIGVRWRLGQTLAHELKRLDVAACREGAFGRPDVSYLGRGCFGPQLALIIEEPLADAVGLLPLRLTLQAL